MIKENKVFSFTEIIHFCFEFSKKINILIKTDSQHSIEIISILGYNSRDWSFNDWNSWRQADGFLCRNDNDCIWLDNNLECQPVRDFGWSINVRLGREN